MTTAMETHDTAAVVAEGGAPVASEKTAAKKVGSRKKRSPKGAKTAKSRKPDKAAKKAARQDGTRQQSKGGMILEMIGRKDGASLEELMAATGWQAHSVRGFLSGTVKKRLKLKLHSTKSKDGERRYRIEA